MTADTPDPRDAIYARARADVAAFRFDAQVAAVFSDMIRRSVPGYALTLDLMAVAARQFAQPGSTCYDLGCSLGATLLTLRHHVPGDCRLVGIDNSAAMIARCHELVAADVGTVAVELREADILDTALNDASLVALNFTLQFVPVAARAALLARIHAALRPGGCLILSEKIAFEDDREQALLTRLHHGFKGLQGYSELEIAQKRSAIENVLIPETLAVHRDRLQAAGFSQVSVWLQCLNFASLLAIK